MNFTAEEKRNLIKNLYDIQADYDCSFTRFRVMDILLETGFTQTSGLEEHPVYEEHKSYFQDLSKEDFEFILKDPGRKRGEKNRTAAYWQKESQLLYYDFGSPFWQSSKKEMPTPLTVFDVGERLISMADEKKEKAMIYNWSAFLIHGIFGEPDSPTQAILERIKAIYKKYDFSEYVAIHESLKMGISSWRNDTMAWFLD